MKNIEKYIMIILIFIAVGAIGAAVYFGVNADKDNKKEEDKQEEVVENKKEEGLLEDGRNEEQLLEQEYISCEKENYKLKSVLATEFNKLTSDNLDVCTKYEIKDLNFTIVVSKDKSDLGLVSYMITDESHPQKNCFEQKSADLNFFALYNKRAIVSYGVNDNFDFLVFGENGEERARITTFDGSSIDVTNSPKILNDSFIFSNIEIKNNIVLFNSTFTLEDAAVSSHDNTINDNSAYCKNNEKYLNITYELVEENGIFKLVEKEFKCS